MADDQEPAQFIVPGRQAQIVVHPPGDIHLFQLTEETLDQLAESGIARSLNALLAAALFGALVTLIVWLLTGDFTTSAKAASATSASIVVSILFLYFGVRGIGDYRRARSLVQRAKQPPR